MKLGIVGTGSFAQGFIPLFKAHPLVDHITLCDLDSEKLAQNAAKHAIKDTSPSLEKLCATDVDAVALFTQNWLHAPQAISALEAGKHVYSAVPSSIDIEETQALVDAVEHSQKIYMLGETSYYYSGVLYCRQRYQQGDFGRIVYAEAEYFHDWDHGLYDVARWRGGENWKDTAGIPPMYYPTHSTSQIISITGAHMLKVSCQGFRDEHEDGIYPENKWQNPFSNESALFSMSDGSTCRIGEFRRVGHPGCVRFSLWGTEASFEDNLAGKAWTTKGRQATQSLDDTLACSGQPVRIQGGIEKVNSDDGTHLGTSSVHPVERLPASFAGLPNGHAGSHQFLVDDFVQACSSGQPPPNNVWDAARYVLPGLVAHQSALQGGTLLDIPDFGHPPVKQG
jgi:predicted dehydrogenase